MRRTLFVAVAGALVACSLSLEGYSGGAEAADSGASTPPPNVAPPPNPAPPPDDAASDGGKEAGVDLCAGTVFCDDFDTGAFGAKWEIRTDGVGSMDFDGTPAMSPPHAVLATIAAGHSGAQRYLTKHLDELPPTNDVEIELDLRLDAACDGNILDLGTDATTDYLFRIYADTGALRLSEYNQQSDSGVVQKDLASLPAMPIAVFQHVKLRANLGAKIGEYWVNGVLQQSVPLAPDVPSGIAHFRIGIVYQNSGTGCSVRYDNVQVRAR
jgi:hypothetical protein